MGLSYKYNLGSLDSFGQSRTYQHRMEVVTRLHSSKPFQVITMHDIRDIPVCLSQVVDLVVLRQGLNL